MNQHRKKLIKEWLDKADGDFEGALLLSKSKKKKKLHFIIAFHCQQAIEKYLKTLLLCYEIDFPKIHDLGKLFKLIKVKDSLLSPIKKDLADLNPYAVAFRYPGDDITSQELKNAIKITKRLRKILLKRVKEFL